MNIARYFLLFLTQYCLFHSLLFVFQVVEYETMRKDVNRSAYTRRILEIVGNIKKQKEEINKVRAILLLVLIRELWSLRKFHTVILSVNGLLNFYLLPVLVPVQEDCGHAGGLFRSLVLLTSFICGI